MKTIVLTCTAILAVKTYASQETRDSLKHNEIESVEIIGREGTSYKSDYTFSGTKTKTPIKEVPMSISTVTKELIQDQQAINLSDVLGNISGVSNNSSPSYNDIRIRGFRSHTSSGTGTGNRYINGLKAGQGFFTNPTLVNIERIEVLKGPASSIYGNINPGGMVNMVTKKPLEKRRKSVNFSVGSFNSMRATGDFTGTLNENKKLLYRFNVGYDKSDTYRDFNGYENYTIAPSITFRPTDKTTFNAEMAYNFYDGKLDRGVPVANQDYKGLEDNGFDVGFTITQPSDWYKVKDVYFNFSLNHKFTDKISFNAAYLRYDWDEDLAEHRTTNKWVPSEDGSQTISDIRYWERLQDSSSDFFSGYLDIKLDNKTWKNNIVAGVDYYYYDTNGGTVSEAREKRVYSNDGTFTEEKMTFDLFNPEYYNRTTDINNYIFKNNRLIGDRAVKLKQYGFYIQDMIELFDDKLNILLGGRYEIYNPVSDYRTKVEDADIEKEMFLPRIGISYALTRNVEVYGNYSTGFAPLSPMILVDNPDFQNEESEQFEAGIKAEFFKGKLLTTLAGFDITRDHVAYAIDVDTYAQDDEQTSRGIEFEATGKISRNFSITANYTYLDTKVASKEKPSLNGEVVEGVPKNAFGFWGKYNFTKGFLKDIGFAIGGNYASSRRHRVASLDLSTPNQHDEYYGKIPNYFVLNGGIFYIKDKFNINLNVKNILDYTYWVGAYDYFRSFPGTPRNVSLSIGYNF